MELLNFIFRLGVVFAIYGFIWSLINFGIILLGGGRKQSVFEVYIFKCIQYLLLVDITFLICYDNIITGLNYNSQLVFGVCILLLYFVGKLQRRQSKQIFLRFYSNVLPSSLNTFRFWAEVLVIAIAVGVFVLFWFQPTWAVNSLSLWFQESILDIEDTPIFGFIFQVIGFLFLVNILFKVINSLFMLLSGRAFVSNNNRSDDDDDHFDPYQEIK